jgi:hypothetical protein
MNIYVNVFIKDGKYSCSNLGILERSTEVIVQELKIQKALDQFPY